MKFLLLLLLTFSLYTLTRQETAKTTRYWDCCKPSCSWPGKADVTAPVKACNKDGVTQSSANDQSGCGNGGTSYSCSNNAPWAVDDNLSYGFAAANIGGRPESDLCCACYKLTFIGSGIDSKQMIVQITNTGSDLNNNHFDLQIPGGGVGIFNGCQSQFGAPPDGWGQRYGGVSSADECNQLPTQLRDGCYWRFNWFKNADNPSANFERIACPNELTSISMCKRKDEPSSPSPSQTLPASGTGIAFSDTDIPGNDLVSRQKPKWSDCFDDCYYTPGCASFSWSNLNGGTCWLKTTAQKCRTTPKSGVISAFLCQLQDGKDIQGHDIGNQPSVDANGCCRICSMTNGCQSYTWNDYNGGTCWLKSGGGAFLCKDGVKAYHSQFW